MADNKFSNKAILVTGAASGMGLATSILLLQQGAQVIMCDINEPGLTSSIASLNSESASRVLKQRMDIADRDSVRAGIDAAKSVFGHLDGIANFAGTGGHHLGVEPVWQTSDEEFDFIVDLNLKGAFHVLSESLEPGVLTDGSCVVHVGSQYSLQSFKNGAVFTAAKHAALGMARAAAKEVAPRLRVNSVLP